MLVIFILFYAIIWSYAVYFYLVFYAKTLSYAVYYFLILFYAIILF